MARTRQKAKQRKAKRLEQERKAAGHPETTESTLAESRQAAADVEEAQERAAVELARAQQDEVGAGAEAARSAAAAEAATAAEVATKERTRPAKPAKPAKPKPAKQPQRAERKREPRQRGRVFNFFVQVWAELRRVQWPDRSQVTQATAVTVVFCAIAGTYLGVWDFLFNKLAKAVL
jgi:preprotein translocase SecE subunit